MSDCTICGPNFIGKCPHNRATKEMVDEVLSWRSDDFGHDCTALIEAESRALQDIGEKYIKLQADFAKLLDASRALRQVWDNNMCTYHDEGERRVHDKDCVRCVVIASYDAVMKVIDE